MAGKYGTFKEYLKDKYAGPFMATDIIIRFNDGKKEGVVLIERKYPPLGIAIPGGIAERMPFYSNSIKEGDEETGLTVKIDEPLYKPLCVFSEVNQDPRAFIATMVYTGQGFGELKPRPEEDAKTAKVFTLEEIAGMIGTPVWAFHHHEKAMAVYLNENIRLLSSESQRKVLNYVAEMNKDGK